MKSLLSSALIMMLTSTAFADDPTLSLWVATKILTVPHTLT